MTDQYSELRRAIRRAIEGIKRPLFSEIHKTFKSEVASLCNDGLVNFGHDYALTDFGLECRVKEIFQRMGFQISSGREGMEDFVVSAPVGAKPDEPVVLEVKSSRKPNIGIDELRQLDDWVFNLSGEERARKHGLGGGYAIVRLMLPHRHPSPHKGAMLFNGPIGTPFNERPSKCINPNHEDFIEKRNFCIIPFSVLLSFFGEYQQNSSLNNHLWEQIHNTSGVLSLTLPPSGDAPMEPG